MSNGLFTFVCRAHFYCDKILWTKAIDSLKRGKKMISREVIPFAVLKEMNDPAYHIFRDAYAIDMEEQQADEIVDIFVARNKALCDREMGWCVPNLGKVLEDFSKLDTEKPLDSSDLPGRIENILFFFRTNGKYGCLSQWYKSAFVVDGIRYETAEQYMMAKKALLFKDYLIYDTIMKEPSPRKCKELGRKVKNFDKRIWKDCREDIVYRGNIEKFWQNMDLLEILLSTNDAVLAEANPQDQIWGIGLEKKDPRATNRRLWRGDNLLGQALMQVRRELAFRYQALTVSDLGVHAGADNPPDCYYISEEQWEEMDKLLKMAVGATKWSTENMKDN